MKEAKWATGVLYSTVPVEADSQFAIHTDYDVESNSLDNARTIDTPSEIYGTVNESEENVFADSYEIRLAAGETLEVLLLAGSLGSSLHPNLLIRTIGNSTPLGTVEELFTGSYDRKATFTPSQLGVYYIVVSHYEGTGGPGAFYRLLVRKH